LVSLCVCCCWSSHCFFACTLTFSKSQRFVGFLLRSSAVKTWLYNDGLPSFDSNGFHRFFVCFRCLLPLTLAANVNPA
jgi:hypothetical protein